MKTTPSPTKDRADLMEALERAFDRDDAEQALNLSNELIALCPDDVEALCLHVAALSLDEELDEALEFCRKAVEAHPKSVELHHQLAELLIDAFGDDQDALEEAVEVLERGCALAEAEVAEVAKADPRADAEFEDEGEDALVAAQEQLAALYLLAADAFLILGESPRALAAADKAKALFPDEPETRVEHAVVLFELCRFEEALEELESALREIPDDAWAIHHLGLIHDHLGHRTQADALIEKAHALDPDACPAQLFVSEKKFEKELEKALGALPDKIRGYLKNVAILVEDLPARAELIQSDPPLSPNSLGMFRGTPVTQQSVSDPFSAFPSAIVLYQRNLERFVEDRDELSEQIGVTLLHEVGHFMGLDEDDLYELGLD